MKLSEMIPFLDHTRLQLDDHEEAVRAFCRAAITPLGSAAAVCVYPKYVEIARDVAADAGIRVATVANFPTGDQSLEQTLSEISMSLAAGADEIDVVIPYRKVMQGKALEVFTFLSACRKACPEPIVLKVILETGVLEDPEIIKQAAELAVESGADFLKTSTGKVAVGATPEAVSVLLQIIREKKSNVGIKISGGIRSLLDAEQYYRQVETQMGREWMTPNHFRIGASRLLDN